ncbi:MAG: glycosyltransferase, partial [Candidatus Sumerlaeia bacterium]|nr:glycosyltransferase [Candidatus Sumerlaeia bacterium]
LYARPNDVTDFASKIAMLLDNTELRQRLGKIGQERIKQHLAWEHSIPHLLSAYKKALAINKKNESN